MGGMYEVKVGEFMYERTCEEAKAKLVFAWHRGDREGATARQATNHAQRVSRYALYALYTFYTRYIRSKRATYVLDALHTC